MWLMFLLLSFAGILLSAVLPVASKIFQKGKTGKIRLFKSIFAGVAVAVFFAFLPVHLSAAERSVSGCVRAAFLSIFNTMQVFAIGCEFGIVTEGLESCPQALSSICQVWASVLFVIAPVFTFSFVLSLFKNVSATLRYIRGYFKDVYVFSELNEKSITLAEDLKKNHKNALIVFTDVFEDNEENAYELAEQADELGAIIFKKDILVVNFKKHAPGKSISFFAIGSNETENLNHALKLIENYRDRANTHLYVFSTKIESELLLTAIDKGEIKVRRINEVQSLVNRVLYEQGNMIFDEACVNEDGQKHICAVVVGMGNHGTEMLKALTWFGQMNGYTLELHAFDKDPLAEEKFTALAPELMSENYNGICIEGEAQYTITIHSGVDVQSATFAKKISQIPQATYVFVALGDDNVNISTAVNLRMYFEREKSHPVIQAVV